jgi:hypothetical protein
MPFKDSNYHMPQKHIKETASFPEKVILHLTLGPATRNSPNLTVLFRLTFRLAFNLFYKCHETLEDL